MCVLSFQDLFAAFNINYTDFIRTTDQNHVEAVQHFWVIILFYDIIYLTDPLRDTARNWLIVNLSILICN